MGQSYVGDTAIQAAISYPQAWAGNTPFAWLGAFTGRSGTPAHGTKWWAVSLPVRDPSGPQHGEIIAHGHRNCASVVSIRLVRRTCAEEFCALTEEREKHEGCFG